jgi:hypothetical protein
MGGRAMRLKMLGRKTWEALYGDLRDTAVDAESRHRGRGPFGRETPGLAGAGLDLVRDPAVHAKLAEYRKGRKEAQNAGPISYAEFPERTQRGRSQSQGQRRSANQDDFAADLVDIYRFED